MCVYIVYALICLYIYVIVKMYHKILHVTFI